MNDEQILELYFQRDQTAISLTRDRYGVYCNKIAMAILQDVQDSEECINDTLFAAWRSIPPKRPENLATYLGRITRNLAINRYRASHTQKRLGDAFSVSLEELGECCSGQEPVFEETRAGEVTESLNRFLWGQKPLDRKVFVCRYYYFDSIADIARRFGIGESRVKSMLYRMRGKLKTHLEKDGISV